MHEPIHKHNEKTMTVFFRSQVSCCPLVRIYHSRKNKGKTNTTLKDPRVQCTAIKRSIIKEIIQITQLPQFMVGYRDVTHQLATVMFNIYQVFSIPEGYINMVF